jgi:subtilisin family serine protease
MPEYNGKNEKTEETKMRNKWKARVLALVLAGVMLFGQMSAEAAAPVGTDKPGFQTIPELLARQKISFGEMDPESEVELIVELEDAPLVHFLPAGMELADYLATSGGGVRRSAVERQQTVMAAAVASAADVSITHRYQVVLNGFAVRGRLADKTVLEDLEGVKRVSVANVYRVPEILEAGGGIVTGGGLIRSDDANAEGYTGKGTFAAVLDTGLMLDHEAFDPEKVRGAAVTADTIGALSGLTARGHLYRNAKIAFAYDYADKDNDVSDFRGHGTHVAGIVAANGDRFRGVAPDAQLAVMKVFSDEGYASDADILAALEDCVILGVDTVNMSLGTPCGFASGEKVADEVYNTVRNAGINLMISAGNDYNSAFRNLHGTNLALVGNPDYGIVASPSTYAAAMSVGSVNADESGTMAGQMSGFSSMGVTPELGLKPEITAPGGNIWSASISGGYEQMSGTSMASPHMAGAAALVRQYVNGKFPGLTDFAKQALVDNLLLSTAVPVLDPNGVAYTPRKQGAGLADVCAAIDAGAYLTVNGGKPKAELGESSEGSYSFTFAVHNISDAARTYTISVDPVAAQVETIGGRDYISELCRNMTTQELDVTLSAESVTVRPGDSVGVNVQLELTEAGREAMAVFPNGIYVEGFVRLEGNDGTLLGLPYLGFYGDWDAAPIFDSTIYDGQDAFMDQSAMAMMDYNGNGSYMGVNAVTGNARPEWISYASRSAGYYLITPVSGLLRAPGEIRYTAAPAEDPGKPVYAVGYENISKTFHDTSGERIYTNFVAWEDAWQPIGEDADGDYCYLADGWYNYTIQARMKGGEACQTQTYPIYIDNQAPRVLSHSYAVMDGTPWLTVEVTDNHFVMAAQLLSGDCSTALSAVTAVEETEEGTVTRLRFDLSPAREQGVELCRLELYDYAGNQTLSDVYRTDVSEPGLDLNALTALYEQVRTHWARMAHRVYNGEDRNAFEQILCDTGHFLADVPAAGCTQSDVDARYAALLAAWEALLEAPVNTIYTDVPQGQWYYDAVDFVTRYGFMNGMDGGAFAPGENVNRAQFVVILHRMAGAPEPTADNPFEDVPDESWFTDAVLWAYETGITTGSDASHFDPGGTLVRQNMVTFLMRFARNMGIDTGDRADLSGYTDAGQIQPYARDALAWAVAEGIISGMTQTSLAPNGFANRAQIATIIQRFVPRYLW